MLKFKNHHKPMVPRSKIFKRTKYTVRSYKTEVEWGRCFINFSKFKTNWFNYQYQEFNLYYGEQATEESQMLRQQSIWIAKPDTNKYFWPSKTNYKLHLKVTHTISSEATSARKLKIHVSCKYYFDIQLN